MGFYRCPDAIIAQQQRLIEVQYQTLDLRDDLICQQQAHIQSYSRALSAIMAYLDGSEYAPVVGLIVKTALEEAVR